ncbi:hypothetical protein [Nitrosomonas sp.]|uniref:hypothetical protein n=1 Tax=Nitrosomonas sp. TaxID=42353 RepID=UPI0032ECDAD4
MVVIEMIESIVGAEKIRLALVKFSLNFVRGNFNPLSSRILRYIRFCRAIFMFFETLPINRLLGLQNSCYSNRENTIQFLPDDPDT